MYITHRYLTSDGQERDETGVVDEGSGDEGGLIVEGFYSYPADEKVRKEHYKADKKGSIFGDDTSSSTVDKANFVSQSTTQLPHPNQTIPAIEIVIASGAISTLAGGGLG